jgi:ABC-type bacteriocin/lantibiotic exporter with double-glycine peptidase domain
MLSPLFTAPVAERLGVPPLAQGAVGDLVRLGLDERSPEGLTQSILEAGARAGISYVRRSHSARELGALLRRLEGPLVVLRTDGDRAPHERVQVLLRRTGSSWRVATGDAEGRLTESDRDTEALLASLGAAAATLLVAARLIEQQHHHDGHASATARLLELIAAEKGNIALVYLYATLVGLFSLTLPLGVQATIGLVSGGLILQPVVLLVSFVVLGTLAYGILSVMQLSVVETIQQRIFARFALELVARLPRLSMEKRSGEDLTERMNRFFEVVTIQKSGAKLLVDGSTALLQVIFGLLLLTVYHPYFAFFGAALVMLLALIFRVTGPKGLATSVKESSYKYRAVSWLEEVARASVSFKYAGRSDLPLSRMDEHVSGYLKYRRSHFGVLVQQKIAMVLFKTFVTGGLLVLGSLLVIDRQITLGQFVASEIVVVTVIAGIEKLIASLADVYDLLTSVEKLAQLRDLELEENRGLALESSTRGIAVAARDLGFRYPNASSPTLHGIDLRIAAGERIGVIGVFGSGESTLLRVLAGVFGGYDGTLTYDGITRSDLDASALRALIGQVLPGEPLFDGTIEENVSLGRSGVGAAEVLASLKAVGAHEFVQTLPQGLRTEVAAGGRTLPATMALRILLARAIVTRPRLLVLDEVFSTLAPPDRREITALLTAPDVPWTLVAASHDDEFLERCDRVLVLHDGGLVAEGPWREVSRVFARQEASR